MVKSNRIGAVLTIGELLVYTPAQPSARQPQKPENLHQEAVTLFPFNGNKKLLDNIDILASKKEEVYGEKVTPPLFLEDSPPISPLQYIILVIYSAHEARSTET